MKKVIINKNDSQQRVDKFLQKYLKDMPLPLIYKYIRKKRVKINGKKTEISYKLQENDLMELYINDEFFETSQKEIETTSTILDVIYEDENIILINKPKGIIVHSDHQNEKETLVHILLSYLYNNKEYNPKEEHSFRPALCNRLDRNTAGIVIGAKNALALKTINEKIKNDEIKKYYLCSVCGIVKKDSDTLIGYHTKNPTTNTVSISNKKTESSKEVITKYKVLKRNENSTLLEINLVTGRSHQIRAHLASIGHPILGDKKYGDKNAKIGNQELVAYKIKFDFKTNDSILNYLNGKEFLIS